jgi:hypothetical protein
MIVIPDEVDQELRRAAAAQRVGALRGIGEILGELLGRYELNSHPAAHTVPGFVGDVAPIASQTVLN